MLVSNIDYDDYVGRIAVGRIERGVIKTGMNVVVCKKDKNENAKIAKLSTYMGLKKVAKLVMSTKLTQQIGKKLCRDAVKTQLLSGTTTIRTVGGLGHFDSELRDKVKEGKLTGPRIVSCDQAVTIPDGHMEGSVAFGAKSDEEFVNFIEKNIEAGVDWVKIMITGGVLDAKILGEPGEVKMNEHQVKLCCDKAHEMGKKVCAHVESPKGIEIALRCGVDSIEHGAALTDELVQKFIDDDKVLVCTLSPAIPLACFPKEATGADDVQVYNSKVLLDGIIDGTKKMIKAGGKVGLGTDTVCPFITQYDMWRELEYVHKLCDVDRKDALHMATQNNASIIGVDNETGSIEKGKSADFIVTDKNPLDGFDTIRNPEYVVFRGKAYHQSKVKKSPVAEKYLDEYLASLN